MMYGLVLDKLSSFQIYLLIDHGSFKVLWIDAYICPKYYEVWDMALGE
jgi:hypothetical protein